MMIRIGLFLCKTIAYVDTHRRRYPAASCMRQDEGSEKDILPQAEKQCATIAHWKQQASPVKFQSTYHLPLGECPAAGGAKALTAGGGEGAQASHKCTFAQLAGEIP